MLNCFFFFYLICFITPYLKFILIFCGHPGALLEWLKKSHTRLVVNALLPSFFRSGAAREPERFRRETCCPVSLTADSPACWIFSPQDARWSWWQNCRIQYLFFFYYTIFNIQLYTLMSNICFSCFVYSHRCSSESLLDHLFLKGSVTEREVILVIFIKFQAYFQTNIKQKQ